MKSVNLTSYLLRMLDIICILCCLFVFDYGVFVY